MNANIFMLFDCFLEKDQEVGGDGYGRGMGWGNGKGWGGGYSDGDSGGGRGIGEGKGYGWDSGDGYGLASDYEQVQQVLCLTEIRRPSDGR